MKVLTPVDRATKRARSIVIDDLRRSNLIRIQQQNIAREAYVMTDEASQYHNTGAGKVFDAHGWTNHSSGQYVDYVDKEIHTNTIESFYSILKGRMNGVYQHCGK